ncbi:MAG TPA: hypothetical protein VJN70_05305, partial [Gemmatimonadaceae bacterium]|nr:hypothetical protein [Gemmatimonadaceae bacterium]
GLTSRRARAILSAVPAADGPIPRLLHERLVDSSLRVPAVLRGAIALGIVFNMAVKPATAGALAVMGLALAVGAAAALMSRNKPREAFGSQQRGAAA